MRDPSNFDRMMTTRNIEIQELACNFGAKLRVQRPGNS